MEDLIEKLKKIDPKFEWPVRIAFTIAIFYSVIQDFNTSPAFPEIAFAMTLIALWLYFFKLRLPALLVLLLQLFFAYTHSLL